MAIVTMTQALKKLYKAVVGEDTTKNNPTKIVSDLADNYSGGGGGGSEPLIINVTENEGTFLMDKTFGEIRQAFDNGRTLLVAQDESYDDTTGLRMGAIIGCNYSVTGGEYPGASGGVNAGNNEYSVSCIEAPYTLEALDAQYPYMGD